jgi:dihydrofolate synthase/folylpolyglutamate synthase
MTTTFLDRLVDLERRPDARPYTEVEYNLDGFRRWVSMMGNPQDGVPWIHIAGTKGKGSTAALCESILHEAGLHTGLFTSPHLAHYGQRYRFDTADWTLDEFNAAATRIEPFIDLRPHDPHVPEKTFRTVFEVLTAIAFREFAAENVQAGVLEVGLGGRLDCTNIVTPIVCAITSMLGITREQIAAEKAGIIKPDVPVVVYDEPLPGSAAHADMGSFHAAREVILARASEVGAPVLDPIPVTNLGIGDEGQHVSFPWGDETVEATLPLVGTHQTQNLGVALRVCEAFIARTARPLPHRVLVARGIGDVRWQGRFEIIASNPTIVLDGAHCPLSAAAAGRTLRDWLAGKPANVHLVWGMQGDKDHGSFLSALAGALAPVGIGGVHCYPVPGRRGAPVDALARVAGAQGFPTTSTVDIESALHQARGAVGPDGVILVAGSLYTLEAARAAVLNEQQDA